MLASTVIISMIFMYAYYIVVLFIKTEKYKLNQGPQAVGYVFLLILRRRLRFFKFRRRVVVR